MPADELPGGDYGINVEASGDVVFGGDVVGRDIITHTIITADNAFERVVGSANFVTRQLDVLYRQTREQAEGWFRFSLIAAGIGFLLIAIGVISVVVGQTTAGVITALSSIVPNAAAALFFIQSKTANDRVDSIQLRLTEAREVLSAVEIANTIDDPKSKDRLKTEIVRKVLRIEKKSSSEAK
jgi:hypothetical protein